MIYNLIAYIIFIVCRHLKVLQKYQNLIMFPVVKLKNQGFNICMEENLILMLLW